MQLNEAQRAVLIRIEADSELTGHFEVLCAALGAALDKVASDPEKTSPFGVKALTADADEEETDTGVIETFIAIAWTETLARAVEAAGGTLDRAAFDADGVPNVVDAGPLFAVGRSCGFSETHLRTVLREVRDRAKTASNRAMKILARLGVLRPGKRKASFGARGSRVRPLAPCFARSLEENEVARAKAGSLFYSLVEEKDGFRADRVRRTVFTDLVDGTPEPITTADEIDGFAIPLLPCPEAREIALEMFVSLLDDRNYTYQRLVYRQDRLPA